MIGVLAVQGSFQEHAVAFERLHIPVRLVRRRGELDDLQGLVIPGGESTTIGMLMGEYGFDTVLRERSAAGTLAIWGTCAGMIVLAQRVLQQKAGQPLLQLMNITVERNAYGRQQESFVKELHAQDAFFGQEPFPCICIRAPKIIEVGQQVRVLATHQDSPIAVQEGRLLATSFHPELTEDGRWHQYFAERVVQ